MMGQLRGGLFGPMMGQSGGVAAGQAEVLGDVEHDLGAGIGFRLARSVP